MKPVIGITCFHNWQERQYRLYDSYVHAIHKAGGLPIILPCLAEEADMLGHLDLVSGLLVSGGADVDPVFYGEEPTNDLGDLNPSTDAYDLPVLRMALKRNLPVLGICRGAQALNIAAGGSVIQHLPAVVSRVLKHSQAAPRHYVTHSVEVVANTLLSSILGPGTTRVNSFHHQAVARVAPSFRIAAVAPDGVVEGIESTFHPFVLGVQWHPEWMCGSTPNFDALFNAFVSAAADYGQMHCLR
jgi:putative glutamine amidotransferase